ncbi:MAG: competence/damage-inducible protein A [Pseudomonadota bacterium]
MKASLIIIGNEILSGRTQDQNVGFIAQKLGAAGISLCEVRIIPDVVSSITKTLLELSSAHDYVFTTGGIGPTHDDITSKTIAETFGLKYELNEEAYQILLDYYTSLGREINPASKKMAYMPEGVRLLRNSVSGAPGFIIKNIYVLPGVPNIMQAMLEDLIPELNHGPAIKSKNLDILVGESIIADKLEALQNKYPNIDVGSYPYVTSNSHATSVVLTSSDHSALDIAYNELAHELLEYSKVN